MRLLLVATPFESNRGMAGFGRSTKKVELRRHLFPIQPIANVEYRHLGLSPDGSKVLFIEADYTDVRERSVLVPGDPSYPASGNIASPELAERSTSCELVR